MVYRIVALCFAILFLSGCVVGRKHDFREAKAVLDYQGEPIALGVQDLRSYVVYGDKDEISRASRAPRLRYSPRHRHRACIRKRRGKWVLDYRDQQGRRHWETVEGNRKAADELLAQRIREVGRGTYQAPHELVDFDALAAAFLSTSRAPRGRRPSRTMREISVAISPPTSQGGRSAAFGGSMSRRSERIYSRRARAHAPSTSA